MSGPGVRQYGFFFDSSVCSGCKTCQAACKDRNGLPVDVLWRRVYEITGGGWRREGNAWIPEIIAYHLSLACHHCEKPICAATCPTGALFKRDDGIVILDSKRCLGCRYCEWGCPYGAPQYDAKRGAMGKCDYCHDLIDEGKAPACVAACPMRALDFGEMTELKLKYGGTAGVFPLPGAEVTKPALVIRPHRDAAKASGPSTGIENWEEV